VLWAKYDGDKSYRFMAVGHAYTYPNSKSISNGLNPSFLKFMRTTPLTEKSVFIFGGDVKAKFDIVKMGNVRLISNGLLPGESARNTVAVVNVGKYGVDIIPTPISQ